MNINSLPDPTIIADENNKIIELNEKARIVGFREGMTVEISQEIDFNGRFYDVGFSEINGQKIIVLRDITGRKKIEAELRESEELFRILIDLSPDGIVLHDGEKILYANRRVTEILGIPEEKLIGRPVFEFIHPEFVDFVAERIKKMFEDKKAVPPAIEKFVLPDGRTLDVEVTASYITYKKRPAILLVIRDVTQIIKMESRYRDFFENTLDMIVVSDLKGNIIEINREAERLSGYKKNEVIGKNFREFFSKEEAEKVYREYNRVFKEKRILYGLEFRLKTKNGDLRIIEGHVRPLLENGEVKGFLANFRDVTERKRLEEELIRTNKLLRVVNTINEIIVKEKDVDKLLSTFIDEISSYCKFAWLALREGGKLKIAKSFRLQGFDDTLFEGWCVQKVLESKRTQEILENSHPPECINFEKHNNMNAYVFPLLHRGKLVGVLALYSDFKISNEEVRLLQMLADDTAFAIETIELEKAREQSLKQIEKNIEQFAILVDRIRNPLAIIVGIADLYGDVEKSKILENVRRIEEIIERLEKGWLESEEVRSLLRGFEDEKGASG